MNVAICLTEGECEVMDFEDAIYLGEDAVEIGYLKINPDRIPVIVSAKIAEEAMDRERDHLIKIDVCGGRYMLLTDDRSVIYMESQVAICGTAYIVRKQGGTYTALTYDEIEDWIYDFEDDEMFAEYFPDEYGKDGTIHVNL